ncbi:MAG TPA: aminotransferase class III-fold pyridoxal phosphate-dependent enzyme, partial [Candidatus Nanopusillus sp.]|nr:aminotransferase class III-fold pyridoxal phosphate-dependent enzyme [Candidatus Nanopusillus sp.]
RKLNEIGLETRGLGLMIGVDVDNAFEIVKRALEKGLVINATSERTLRLVPPLVIKREEIDYAIEILEEVIR